MPGGFEEGPRRLPGGFAACCAHPTGESTGSFTESHGSVELWLRQSVFVLPSIALAALYWAFCVELSSASRRFNATREGSGGAGAGGGKGGDGGGGDGGVGGCRGEGGGACGSGWNGGASGGAGGGGSRGGSGAAGGGDAWLSYTSTSPTDSRRFEPS